MTSIVKLHSCKLSLLVILESCLLILVASSFSCNDYSGAKYATDFCVSIACNSYCAHQSNPESCMESNYLMPGFCAKGSSLMHSGDLQCNSIVGVQPEWTQWCQTTACAIGQDVCKLQGSSNCPSRMWTLKHFEPFCKEGQQMTQSGPGPFPTPSTPSIPSPSPTPIIRPCWAHTSWWYGSPCEKCPPGGTCLFSCKDFSWTPCHNTKAECERSPIAS